MKFTDSGICKRVVVSDNMFISIFGILFYVVEINHAFNINSQAFIIKKEKPSILYFIVGLLYISSPMMNASMLFSANRFSMSSIIVLLLKASFFRFLLKRHGGLVIYGFIKPRLPHSPVKYLLF